MDFDGHSVSLPLPRCLEPWYRKAKKWTARLVGEVIIEAVTNRNETRGRLWPAGVGAVAPMLLAPVLFLLGCQTPLCNAQATAASYGVTVIEPYDAATQFHFRSGSGLDLPGIASCAARTGLPRASSWGFRRRARSPTRTGSART